MELLEAFHRRDDPRIIIGLRLQDPLPPWITHVVFVEDGTVTPKTKETALVEGTIPRADLSTSNISDNRPEPSSIPVGKPIIDIQGLNIAYHERKVCTRAFRLSIKF